MVEKSIVNNLHSDGFFRMKIGIKSDLKRDVIDYVLGKFSKSELDLIDFQKINNAILDFINNDYMYVMNKYNGK